MNTLILGENIAGSKWGLKQYLKMDRLEDQSRELAAQGKPDKGTR